MSAVPLTSASRDTFVKRISAIQSDSKRKWGSMEPTNMLAHLTCILEMSLGEIPVKDGSSFFSRQILKRLVFQSPMSWPKGKIKAPDEFTPPAKGDFESERTRLISALDRFVAASEREPSRTTLHPFFGPFTMTFWQLAHGKHINHHCEQFGV